MNRSDSLSVLRTSDEVLVNANDALHCYDDGCIDFYCQRIQSLAEHRPIDYLFCGFGGASSSRTAYATPRRTTAPWPWRARHTSRRASRALCRT